VGIDALRLTALYQSKAREFRGVLSLHHNDPLDVLCSVISHMCMKTKNKDKGLNEFFSFYIML